MSLYLLLRLTAVVEPVILSRRDDKYIPRLIGCKRQRWKRSRVIFVTTGAQALEANRRQTTRCLRPALNTVEDRSGKFSSEIRTGQDIPQEAPEAFFSVERHGL